ncbi:MAG: hypothetical protein HRU19_19740 [Pseudobacteriovorax sp.]|nr:hypothetical protein [Pseudobacteriovorax sp.]
MFKIVFGIILSLCVEAETQPNDSIVNGIAMTQSDDSETIQVKITGSQAKEIYSFMSGKTEITKDVESNWLFEGVIKSGLDLSCLRLGKSKEDRHYCVFNLDRMGVVRSPVLLPLQGPGRSRDMIELDYFGASAKRLYEFLTPDGETIIESSDSVISEKSGFGLGCRLVVYLSDQSETYHCKQLLNPFGRSLNGFNDPIVRSGKIISFENKDYLDLLPNPGIDSRILEWIDE